MNKFSIDQFQNLLQQITDVIRDHPLNQALEDKLNEKFPCHSAVFLGIKAACLAGIDAGVLCPHEAGDIQFGRVIKPCPELGGLSVDLVRMKDIRGPHHGHPKGEVDLVMPLDAEAKFDDRGAGWVVYGAGSTHFPTVSGGEALVLYLLPNGEIDFTGKK